VPFEQYCVEVLFAAVQTLELLFTTLEDERTAELELRAEDELETLELLCDMLEDERTEELELVAEDELLGMLDELLCVMLLLLLEEFKSATDELLTMFGSPPLLSPLQALSVNAKA
jgi:hypothetical protein